MASDGGGAARRGSAPAVKRFELRALRLAPMTSYLKTSWKQSSLIVAAALGVCLAGTSQGALVDDLVGLYQFENNFLDTSASATGNHGVAVNGPGFVDGKIGTAMSLTGVRDYMSLDHTLYPELDFGPTGSGTQTDFSIGMWIRQDDFLSDPAVFSNKDWSTGNNTGINWAVKGNGIFDLNTKGDVGSRRDLDTAANSAPLGVGVWSLVVMSLDRDGSTRLFINGNQTGVIPLSSEGDFNGSLPWNVGQDGTGEYPVEFTGAVDELAIWRRALDAGDVSELWNGGNGLDLSSQVVDKTLRLTVDRVTGGMTILNATGVPQDLKGYQITSQSGALDQTGWTPIAGRLDATGDQSIDADDNWLVATRPGSVGDLSELSLGTGTLAPDTAVSLGSGTWRKYFRETSDVRFQYADAVSDELILGRVEFVGDGFVPYDFGDLDFDRDLDSDDWVQLQTHFGVNLTGLSTAQRYRAADLNDDGRHDLDDILQFQIAFDAAHGAGAFLAMTHGVPEPVSAALALALTGLVWLSRGGRGRRCRTQSVATCVAIGALLLVWPTSRLDAALYFSENFDELTLGASVDETPAANVWTNTPPSNWSIDKSGVPANGTTEWEGWAFTDPSWWSLVAQDQGRSLFTKGRGVIAVADPDEWDDQGPDQGTYNTFLRTPPISIAGASPGSLQLQFDSSWVPEDFQTANLTVSYNGGPQSELFRWTSVGGDPNFKPAANNETVLLPLQNPPGATSLQLEFGMFDAGNDWWWAIDNLSLFSPLTLEIDVQSGAMRILSDPSIELKAYEIASPSGTLNPAAWRTGNLAAQGTGTPLPAASDFNSSGLVDQADLAQWAAAFGVGNGGDTDADGDSDGDDFLRWQRQHGQTSDPASTWLTFLATDTQLVEAYLLGKTVIASNALIGDGYNPAVDARDVTFTYTNAANEKLAGAVRYVNSPGGAAAIPEPAAWYLAAAGMLLAMTDRRGVWGVARRTRFPGTRFPGSLSPFSGDTYARRSAGREAGPRGSLVKCRVPWRSKSVRLWLFL
jgi:hypothetical protein